MPKPLQTPDRIFDRTWRPGHPYRPRLSRRRRAGMIVLFLLLCGLIGAYRYFTNSARVRAQAEAYLSRLTGGRVTVGGASLSIFEGLRLDDVRVHVGTEINEKSRIFSAATFLIQYDPAALLKGDIEAHRIVAIDPRVRLSEDSRTGLWNYSQLHPRPQSSDAAPRSRPRVLPEISLRNAMVEYVQSGKADPSGSVSIDGQITPGPGGAQYSFKLQSRGGENQLIGPRAEGTVALASGEVDATLYNLVFERDRAMLPRQVQDWWTNHELKGDVKETSVWMNPSDPEKPFRVNISMENVALTVQPKELLSREEMQRRAWTNGAFAAMRAAGLDEHGFVDHLAASLEATAISLKKVNADFTFTHTGIDINNLEADIDENRFRITGHYDAYTSDAKASLNLTNLPDQVIRIPEKVAFINSLPAEVREVYTRFRPQGTCNVKVSYIRPEQGARPQVTCEVDVLDGNFVFERFPLPITRATGRIAIGRDPATREEHLTIERMRGKGAVGGPNENAVLQIDGVMGPFTPAIEVHVTVRGQNIVSEPSLIAAFPPNTRKALKFFDAEGKGNFPTFKGNFTSTIHRRPQVVSHWDVETDIELLSASGAVSAFPYPMDGVTGDLHISEEYLDIREARFRKGETDLQIKGRVTWGPDDKPGMPKRERHLRPELTFIAKSVPIDHTLLHALPPLQSKWLRKLGAAGKFDLSGELTHTDATGLDFTFDVDLNACSLWPVAHSVQGTEQSAYALTDLTGKLKLTPRTLTLSNLHGKRGQSDVTAHGEVSWPTSPPQVSIIAEAKNLPLDRTLYDLLPPPAQRGWDTVQPEGTVDARITYSGAPREEAVVSVADIIPTTQPACDAFEVSITPRKLAITPKPVPYRLENLTGAVTITPTRVKLDNIVAHHGDAEVRMSGTGSTDPNGVWEFALSGDKMLVDEDFNKALPATLQALLKSSKMNGAVAFEFTKLKIWNDPITPSNATTTPTSNFVDPSKPDAALPDVPDPNIDFTLRFKLANGAFDPGVPLTNVTGSADFTGASRNGKLTELAGRFDIPTLEIAGRPANNLRAELIKRPGRDAMKLANLQTQIVGGQLAGQIEWDTTDAAASRYAMNLVLHNADAKTLTGEKELDVQGTVSASLSMMGKFDDAKSRRGGGDVSVAGEQLYKIPLILGLMQITNLSLPITSPFNEGTCRYSVDGQRVTFDTIELRAKEMTMSGNGRLDFDTNRVNMSFTTQSSNWLKLPVVNDLLQGARNELLQVHVRGTIEQPKVSGSSLGTFMTTVDEVFKGGSPPPDMPPVKKPKK